MLTNEETLQLLHPLFEISLFCLGNDNLPIAQLTRAGFTKVCIIGVVALFGDCRDIPIDLGVIVKQIWYVHLSKDVLL